MSEVRVVEREVAPIHVTKVPLRLIRELDEVARENGRSRASEARLALRLHVEQARPAA